MLRKLLILAGGLAFACGSSAWADPINPTQLAGFSGPGLVSVAAPPTPLSTSGGVTGLGAGAGVSYINQFAGAPLGIGSQFKTIGSFLVNTINPNGGTPGNPAANGGQLVAVFALEGTIVNRNGPAAQFNQGVIAYYSSSTANYQRNDLSTWGITGTNVGAKNSGTLVGMYALKQPVGVDETLVKGNPNAYTPNTNAQTANIVAAPGNSSNNFTGGALFHDIGTYSGNNFTLTQPDFFANNGLASTFGRTIYGPNGSPPPNFSFILPTFEHDFTDTFQTTPLAQTFDFSANGNGAQNLAIANNFFHNIAEPVPDLTLPDGTVIPGGASLGTGGFDFATGLGAGPQSNFLPDFNGTTSTTGDLVSDTTSANQFAPSVEFGLVGTNIPEIDPNSLAGALTLLGGGLLYLTDRRYRAKK
jgi:hypothetical protein